MKKVIVAFFLLSLWSCKKENIREKNQLEGQWLFEKGIYSTGGMQSATTTPDPSQPIYIEFKENGLFTISTQVIYTGVQATLQTFNRYRVIGDTLVFYNTNATEQVRATFNIDRQLSIYSLGCREACIEQFVRKN